MDFTDPTDREQANRLIGAAAFDLSFAYEVAAVDDTDSAESLLRGLGFDNPSDVVADWIVANATEFQAVAESLGTLHDLVTPGGGPPHAGPSGVPDELGWTRWG